MKTLALPISLIVLTLALAACSVFVEADLSKVKDPMYDIPDAGEAVDSGVDAGSKDAASEDDAGADEDAG